jgi:secreted effector protein PipB2
MYKPPPPEVVRQLEQNRRWMETFLKEGKEALLAFVDYEGLDLSKAILHGATLQESNFSRCCLDDADLGSALANGLRLEGASLARTNFIKADLVEADFSNASGPEADFTKAILNKARFDGGSFRRRASSRSSV